MKRLTLTVLFFLLYFFSLPGEEHPSPQMGPASNGNPPENNRAIVVTPQQFTFSVSQFSWKALPLTLTNTGNSTVTYQITDTAGVSGSRRGLQIPAQKHLSSNYRQLKGSIPEFLRAKVANAALSPVTSQTDNQLPVARWRTTVITDSSGDTNLPGADIISVDYSESGFYYTLTIHFAGSPDTNSIGILSVDTDQNFGTGAFPAPFGYGLGNFDIGSEYEIVFDFANLIGDTLATFKEVKWLATFKEVKWLATFKEVKWPGTTPLVFVLNSSDSSLVGIPLPINFSGSSASVNFPKPLFPVFSPNMNLGATMLPLTGTALPDVAPNFGHGLYGSELGASWITELDSALTAQYPLSGSLIAGDSVTVFVKVSAAYPMGNYTGELTIHTNGPNNPILVPVSMHITFPGQPAISVSPMNIADTLDTNSGLQTYHLEITNTGSGTLLFTVLDSVYNGENWLTVPNPFGSVPANQAIDIPVEVDPQNLTPNTLYQAQLTVISNDLTTPAVAVPITIFVKPATGIADRKPLPRHLVLHANYPNPFNPETHIRFDLPEAANVRLDILNLLGQKIFTVVDGYLSPGSYRYRWKGQDQEGAPVASGIYFYRLQTADQVLIRKMLLSR